MLQNLNNLTSLLLKLTVIIAIVLAVLYFGVSIWGNIALSRAAAGPGDVPNLSDAPYRVSVRNTGQTLLAKNYVSIKSTDPEKWDIIHYYTLVDNKWMLVESTLSLDEYYWGPIKIERRVKDE